MYKSSVDTWRICVMYGGSWPLDSWWNSTPFWPLTLVCSLMGSGVTQSHVKPCQHVSVTCLGPCPLDSWWNCTPFWPLTLVCSSKGSGVTKSRVNHVSTRDRHVSRVWDHTHWIPGEILPQFDVRHVLIAHLEPKLKIYKYLEQYFYSGAPWLGNF